MPAVDALLDDEVLQPLPTLEFQGTTAVRARGGRAVLPWRAAWLAARAQPLDAVPDAEATPAGSFAQAVVHLQPSRAATLADVAEAWRCLGPGGRLLLVGDNRLGIASFARALGQQLGRAGVVLANRGRGRIVAFTRDGHSPAAPAPHVHRVPDLAGEGELTLRVAPGVFSHDAPDAGTTLLLELLAAYPAAPRTVVDVGCGAGHLALSALRRWPAARAVLADGDWRAVGVARQNAEALGLAAQTEVHWWDASEPLPAAAAELALLNPPWHRGAEVDLAVARAMFRAVRQATARGARVLVVANRRLPYEADLRALGELRLLRDARGFKLLEVTRD